MALAQLGGALWCARAAWQPAPSICEHMPGFAAKEAYPSRGPLLVADFLIPEVIGRRYVEIGSRNGDLSTCLSHFARKVIVVEAETPYCAALRARNLTVLCHRVTRENVALLPTADVYFWWMFPSLNLELARMVHSAMVARNRSAKVYFPVDTMGIVPGAPRDIKQVYEQLEALRSARFGHSGAVERVFFDETLDDRQAELGEPVAAEGNVASYAHEFYGRYGRWGVLHMLSARVGKIHGTVQEEERKFKLKAELGAKQAELKAKEKELEQLEARSPP